MTKEGTRREGVCSLRDKQDSRLGRRTEGPLSAVSSLMREMFVTSKLLLFICEE